MSPVELCWNITSYVSIIVQLGVAGICFGIFVSPYMLGRSKAIKAGTVYGVVMMVLYIMHAAPDRQYPCIFHWYISGICRDVRRGQAQYQPKDILVC